MGTMHIFMEWLAKRAEPEDGAGALQGRQPRRWPLCSAAMCRSTAGAGGQAPHVKAGTLRTLLQISGEPQGRQGPRFGGLSLAKRFPKAPIDVVRPAHRHFRAQGYSRWRWRNKLTEAFTKAAQTPACVHQGPQADEHGREDRGSGRTGEKAGGWVNKQFKQAGGRELGLKRK